MANLDVTRTSPSVARIAEPHQSTVGVIVRAAALGLFTAAEADLLIDRVRGRASNVVRAPSEQDSLLATARIAAPKVRPGRVDTPIREKTP